MPPNASAQSNNNLIGLIGGTFDPPHIGHLRMALEAQAALNTDQMLFLPAPTPPHKPASVTTSHEHRVNMLKAAIQDHPGLSINNIEFGLPGPHYTVRTLSALRKHFGPEQRFCWIMGMDSLLSLPHWHEWRRLMDQTHFVVAQRPRSDAHSQPKELDHVIRLKWTQDAELLRSHRAGYFYELESVPLDIASSKIRQLLHEGKPIDYLVPQSVFDYIRQNRLYCK